jgi:ABC-type transport system involved in cytochrome c biogenesis ATPase subunit
VTAPIHRCLAAPIDRAVKSGGQVGRSNRAGKSTLLRLLAGLDHTLHQTPSASEYSSHRHWALVVTVTGGR